MQKKSSFFRLFPPRFWAIGSLLLSFNCLVYYGARLVNLHRVYHCVSLPLDAKIPFVPAFIFIYVLAFVQWGLGYLLLAHSEKTVCRRYVCGLLIAKALCGICFLLYPTCMTARPIPSGTGLPNRLTALIFAADTPPDNLFPSIHCLESWMCLRLTLRTKALPRWVKVGAVIFTILVFASVLLVKQHVLVDIPAGIAAGELGLLLARSIIKERKSER